MKRSVSRRSRSSGFWVKRKRGRRRVQKYKRTQDWLAGTFRNRRIYAWLANGSGCAFYLFIRAPRT